MKDSQDQLVPISEEDVHYILEDNFDEQCHKATYDILCKNCGKKCQMASAPKLFVSAKGDIIIDGHCSNCNKPLLSKIKTSKRIDWQEYAMVVRDARVCYAARGLGNHKSDRKQDVPKSNPHQTGQSNDNNHSASLL
jgi:hypothetical protein